MKGEALRTLELCLALCAVSETLTPNLDYTDCEADGEEGSDTDSCGNGAGDGTDLLLAVWELRRAAQGHDEQGHLRAC